MLRRMCALPLRRTGSMAEVVPAASAEPAPAATAEPRNWRRVGMVMAVCSGELGEWPEYNPKAKEKHELFTFSSNISRRAKKESHIRKNVACEDFLLSCR